MKETRQDAYLQTASNKTLFETKDMADMNDLVVTRSDITTVDEEDAMIDESTVVDIVAAAAEELQSVAVVQEHADPVADQSKSIQAKFDGVVDAAKDKRAEIKAAETISIAEEDVVGSHITLGSTVEDVICPERNDEGALKSCVKTTITDEEHIVFGDRKEGSDDETTASDGSNEDSSADSAAKLESIESAVVLTEIKGEDKAIINCSNEKVVAENQGASSKKVVAALVTGEEPVTGRSLCTESVLVVEADANEAIAEKEVAEAAAEEEDPESTSSTTLKLDTLHVAESVTQALDVSVQVIATEPTVAEVVMEADADVNTNYSAISTELGTSADDNIDEKVLKTTKDEIVAVYGKAEEATATQEQEVSDEDMEAFDNEANTAAESNAKPETTDDRDTPVDTIATTNVKEAEAAENFVVEIDTGATKENEVVSIDEDADVDGDEAEAEAPLIGIEDAAKKDDETDTTTTSECTEVVEQEETETAASSAKIDASIVTAAAETDTTTTGECTEVVEQEETETAASSAKIDASIETAAEPGCYFTEMVDRVVVEDADTQTVSVAEKIEVQLKKSDNGEVTAVKNELATEEVEETEKAVDTMREESQAVAAVETASSTVKANDSESTVVEQVSAVKASSAHETLVDADLTVSSVNECEHDSKSSGQFAVDTKRISAVSTLIGRFEQMAKRVATEAESLHTSFRVSSPLSSPPLSSCENVFETVARSNKMSEHSSDGPVCVESSNVDVLTNTKEDHEAAEVETTATVAEAVDETTAVEKTIAGNVVCKPASSSNDMDIVTPGNTSAAADADAVVKESFEVASPAVEINGEKSTLKAEAASEQLDVIDKVAVVESVEQAFITESAGVDVEVTAKLGVTFERADSIAEPEAEDADIEITVAEETSDTTEGSDAAASEAIESNGAFDEIPVAVVSVDGMLEADVDASETQPLVAGVPANDMVEADVNESETQPTLSVESALSVDGSNEDMVKEEAVSEVEEIANDTAFVAMSLLDMEEAAAIACVTTDQITDNSIPMTSDFASELNETQTVCNELQVDGGNENEDCQPLMERRMSSTGLALPNLETDDGVYMNEITPTQQTALTSPAKEEEEHDNTVAAEATPECDSEQLIPYEHLTYEILGVTRANNVIMYHIYIINRLTGDQVMSIPKRYSEFKILDEQLRSLDVPSVQGLPELPKPTVSSFFRGRRCQKTIELREKAFRELLHYVRDHEDLHKSVIFQQFVANQAVI